MNRTWVLLLGSAALAACGGNEVADEGSNEVDYAALKRTGIEAKALKQASAQELENHLKNGIRLNVSSGGVAEQVLAVGDAAVTAAAASEHSSTNTHVKGVDETDYVKYDGRYLFMATQPEYLWDPSSQTSTVVDAKIRILETDPANAGIQEVGVIDVADSDWGEVGELYLVSGEDNRTTDLVTLRTSWSYLTAAEPALNDALFMLPAPMQNRVQIASYNVEDPASARRDFTVEIDGYLQASRKIGNTLYLVTNYSPYLPMLTYSSAAAGETSENEQRLADLGLADLLPSVSINGGADTPLHEAGDCYLPADLDSTYGYSNIVSIVAIDLAGQRIASSKCLNSEVSGIYSSTDNLYIGGSVYAQWPDNDSYTVVHKFSLGNNEVSYRSTGVVPGVLGWQDPSFRMDEHNSQLRIVTTRHDANWAPSHLLHVLRDPSDGAQMETIAALPNEQHPEPIGKPNEDIQAVRFHGDRAFVVTFRRIDPLYVLDLADAANPFIAGQLEIPGFSSYLHPVSDNYLLGIGYDGTDTGTTTGVKTSLFDIRDLRAPVEINSMVIGEQGTWSPALNDLRAITFLEAGADQLRFAFPVSTYGADWQWQEEALHLFEVNGLASGNADLLHAGKIVSEQANDQTYWASYSGTDRSVLHGEAVYYTHGADVWAALWSNPAGAVGPR